MNDLNDARSTRGRIRLAWLLGQDRQAASSRILGWRIHEWMRQNGMESQVVAERMFDILSAYESRFFRILCQLRASPATHVILVSPTYIMDYAAELARRWGRRVVCVRCDLIAGAYDRRYDLTILPTPGLQEALHIEKGVVIDDMVEAPPEACKSDYAGGAVLRVAWVGHEHYAKYISQLIAELQKDPRIGSHFAFEIISRGSFATRPWAPDTFVRDILACDVAMIPIPQHDPWYHHKSANRLALMFSLGMPVVATPLASYRTLATHGDNVLFAATPDEFATQLQALRSADLRRQLGTQARRTAAHRFSLDCIGPQWLAALASIPPPAKQPPASDWRLRALGCAVTAATRLSALRPRGRPGSRPAEA